jgi:hypothetical protein
VNRLLKRVNRLKERAGPLIAERNRRDKYWFENIVPRQAEEHLLRLILVFRYGNPRIDEPLARAQKRGLLKLGIDEGAAVNHMRRLLKEERGSEKTHWPYVPLTEESFSRFIAHNNIKPQISKWVMQMPDWLLYLCAANISMSVLGLKRPMLAPDVFKLWFNTKSDLDAWPSLPQGMLGPRPEHMWTTCASSTKILPEKQQKN